MKYTSDKAFTLVELLIVISILGIIGIIAGNLLITGWKTEKFNREKLSLQSEARIILLRLPKDLRQIMEIDAGTTYIKIKVDTNSDGDIEDSTDKYKRYEYDNNKNSINYWSIPATPITDDNDDGWPDDWGDTNRVFAKGLVKNLKFVFNDSKKELEIKIDFSQNPNKEDIDNYSVRDKFFLRLLN